MSSDVSIVTGASRGIGRAIAVSFAKEGHKLALCGRSADMLEETKSLVEKEGAEAVLFLGDVADEKFAEDTVNKVIARFGRLDHLVNNAGTAVFKNLVDSSLDEFKKQIDANVYGVYNFSKAAAGKFIEQRSGSIINIASVAGKFGFAGGTMYTATKHAVMGFTKSLMLELRRYDIRVSAVCPGSVSTELLTDTFLEPENPDKILAPEDVAEIVTAIIKLPPRAVVPEMEIRPNNPK